MRGHNSNYLCHNICIFEIVNIFRLSWWISTFLAFLFSFMFTLISVLVFHVICLILTQTDETHFVFCCRINRNESSPETRVYLPSNNHLHVKRRDFSEGGGGCDVSPRLCLFISVFAFQIVGMHLHDKLLPLNKVTHTVSQNVFQIKRVEESFCRYQICFTKYY